MRRGWPRGRGAGPPSPTALGPAARSLQAWGRSHKAFTCTSLKTDGAVAVGLCSEGAWVQTVPLLSATFPLGRLSFSHWLEESQVCAARGPVTDTWPGRGRVAGSPRLGGVHVGPRQLPSGRHRTGGVGAHRPRQSWGLAGRRVWGQKELPWKEGSLEWYMSPGYPSPGFSRWSGVRRPLGRGGADWVRWLAGQVAAPLAGGTGLQATGSCLILDGLCPGLRPQLSQSPAGSLRLPLGAAHRKAWSREPCPSVQAPLGLHPPPVAEHPGLALLRPAW